VFTQKQEQLSAPSLAATEDEMTACRRPTSVSFANIADHQHHLRVYPAAANLVPDRKSVFEETVLDVFNHQALQCVNWLAMRFSYLLPDESFALHCVPVLAAFFFPLGKKNSKLHGFKLERPETWRWENRG